MAKQKTTRTRHRTYRNIEKGQAHITSTFNNTTATLTDVSSNVISWTSVGQLDFRGSHKSTPSATQEAAQGTAEEAREHGLESVEVFAKGPGSGHEAAIRSLQASGPEVAMIKDVTPILHNDRGPPKRRRV